MARSCAFAAKVNNGEASLDDATEVDAWDRAIAIVLGGGMAMLSFIASVGGGPSGLAIGLVASELLDKMIEYFANLGASEFYFILCSC